MDKPSKPIINSADVPLRDGGYRKELVGKFAVSSRYDWSTGKGGIRFVGRQAGSLDYWDSET